MLYQAEFYQRYFWEELSTEEERREICRLLGWDEGHAECADASQEWLHPSEQAQLDAVPLDFIDGLLRRRGDEDAG